METTAQIQSIYTDGACSGNPGPGGWGVVVCYNDETTYELGGSDKKTTNNRMEMQAAIAALEFFKQAGQIEPITIYTDSEYLKNGITQWVKGWKKKGWQTSAGKPVLNQDLWEILDQLNTRLVHWQHVRGHSGNFYNDRCDTIARGFSMGKPPYLKQNEATLTNSAITHDIDNKTIQSTEVPSENAILNIAMTDSNAPFAVESTDNNVPSEFRVSQLRDLVETLRIADEVAEKGYLITSSELANLMDVNASAVTSRGDNWVWRNWHISRVRREGNQILWQLERVLD
ncbi:ribonuclease HI [Ancylothrix sp. C2]|uniref:ribonuclease HI n=1 Tax=Ancylothrix sp. D3o TaxID=2953691 RepID=UPI0021BB1F6E|nr:ribonuclease HI [Ancylothrix sp. D3o]MCT7950365.1 ribonuclease HI [Ancylothrix sp. D3o]